MMSLSEFLRHSSAWMDEALSNEIYFPRKKIFLSIPSFESILRVFTGSQQLD